MNGEWTKVLDHLCDPECDTVGMAVDLMWRLRKCPNCRALIEEQDTLTHELACWP
jgi:hypothetical protein